MALPAVAHAGGDTLKLGGFVGMDFLPGDVELGNSWAPDQVPESGPALGGRLTDVLLPQVLGDRDFGLDLGVEVELQLAMSSTGSNTSAGRSSYASPLVGGGAHLIAALETGTSVSPLFVVGGGANAMFTRSPFASDDIDPVGYWGLGVSWKLARATTLRVDLRQGVEAGRMNDVTSTFDAEVGLSFAIDAPRPEPEPTPIWDLERPPPGDHTVVTPPPPPVPKDTDADGIADDADKCPDAAEDKDGFQDEDGCPDLDNDGDGFPDAQDQCPNEAETINGFQDDDGCADALPAPLAAINGPAPKLTFPRGKAKLTPAAKKALDELAATLRKYRDERLGVVGRPIKGVSDNLARRRAEAVKWYLIDAGIAADRIDTSTVLVDPANSGGAAIELQRLPTTK